MHYFSSFIPVTISFFMHFMSTGNALESDVAFFLNAGADSVLIKPFSMVDFLSSMASVAIRMAAQNNN